MKYEYQEAVKELKASRSVEEIHAVLEKCPKSTLEKLNIGEGFGISPKCCERKKDWQSYVYMELKRIFEFIEGGDEIVSRRVGIYDAEHGTFEMTEGVGEITTAWTERKRFEVTLGHVMDGQYLPYCEYSHEELMRLADVRNVEVSAVMSREELEEAVIHAGIMNPEDYSYLWALLLLKNACGQERIAQILNFCARSVIEDINASENLGIEAEMYPEDKDFRNAVILKLSDIYDDVYHGDGESVCEYGEIVAEWEQHGAMLRNYELAKKINAYLDSQAQPEMTENNTQEENTMTRITVSEAVTAVKGATTAEAIRDALMMVTVKDMLKVCTEVTGVENAVKTGGLKAQTAEKIADFIMRDRKEKAFKALPLAEKYAAMTEKPYSEICTLPGLCSVEELREIAGMLKCPIDDKYAEDRTNCLSMMHVALWALNMERSIMERIAKGADKEDVKNELRYASCGMHEVLMRRAGIELEGALPCDVIIGMLASHFMKGNQPTPPANPEPEKRTATYKPTTPPSEPEPEINPEDTSEAEYNLLQVSICISMRNRTALKNAMKLLDPKSKDYSVLNEIYDCEGLEIEECVERRRVIHKAITALEEVRVRKNRQSAA